MGSFVGNIGRCSFEGRINFGKKGVPEGVDIWRFVLFASNCQYRLIVG